MHLGMTECHIPFWVTMTLTSDLVFRIILSGSCTEQQKKRIFCIFGIVYKLGFKY